ncbi:hypothetical protein [Allosalinactinospora lopnorensis]|uniref:hypothetical protein n=1 Tax=Allosalinactinospora lopnorensis TaxID=1352348 RepID=UPI000623C21F|nr:hypothetical protein [Allosalinactinospora lopnorensis]
MTDPWHEGLAMSSSTPNSPDEGPAGGSKHGFLAWFVFILAIGVMLSVIGGCMALVYGPLFTGG